MTASVCAVDWTHKQNTPTDNKHRVILITSFASSLRTEEDRFRSDDLGCVCVRARSRIDLAQSIASSASSSSSTASDFICLLSRRQAARPRQMMITFNRAWLLHLIYGRYFNRFPPFDLIESGVAGKERVQETTSRLWHPEIAVSHCGVGRTSSS